jgi:hypothetical protein
MAPTTISSAAGAARPVVLRVDDDAAAGGDGSARHPYDEVPAAVAEARTLNAPTVIVIAPGTYPLASSLLLDFPVELRGSTVPAYDYGDPWPNGAAVDGTETRIFGEQSVGVQPLIKVGRADGNVINGVTIRGLTLQGAPGGIQILLTRVQGYTLADNLFRTPGFLAVQSIASSGTLKGNHFSGVSTAIVANGGYPASPSSITVKGNRAVHNLGGILLNGASFNIPELGNQLDAVVRDNDWSSNPTFGLRVFVLRRDPGAPGDTQFSAAVKATIEDNRIDGNGLGVSIDAGFPYRQTATCDPRIFSGRFDLDFKGNTLTNSSTAATIISFTRYTAALNPAMLGQWQYLHGASFNISDADGMFAGAWIDNPATDPFIGPCPMDATHEPLHNVLMMNGTQLPSGRNF